MPHLAQTAKVNAPLAIAWEQLVSKIHHPERFWPVKPSVEILEDDAANRRVVRKMKLDTGKLEITTIEEITWDEASHFIDFKILEHPSHTGNVINKI